VTKAHRHKGARKGIIKTYRDLLIQQKAMVLVMKIHQISKAFSRDETYGLTAQMRRCAISIPSNIAEKEIE